MSQKKQERVQKLIAQAGYASRRKAEQLIIAKQVTVNGRIITLGAKASFEDDLKINGVPLFAQEHVYYLMNKPLQTITSVQDDRGRRTVIDVLDVDQYVFPVGRLDYNTTGTLLLTNDGALTNKLTHPSFQIKRVYRARLNRVLTKDELIFLNSEAVIIGTKQSNQTVRHLTQKTYLVILHEGRYHHVKEIFGAVEATVQALTRIEYAGISHVGMARGAVRKLKTKEIKYLKKL